MLGNIDLLTDRESEVIKLATSGMTDKQVAGALGVSSSTVTTYWFRIKMKLNARSRSEAIAKYAITAMSLGYVSEDSLSSPYSDQDFLSKLTSSSDTPFLAWISDAKGALKHGYGNFRRYVSTVNGQPSEGEWKRFTDTILGHDDLKLLAAEGRLTVSRKFENYTFEVHAFTHVSSERIKDIFVLALDTTKFSGIGRLDASQRMAQSVLDRIPAMTLVWSIKDEHIVYANNQAFYFLGYPAEQLVAMKKDVMNLVHREDVALVKDVFAHFSHSHTGEVRPVSFRIRTSEGNYMILEGRCSPYRTGNLGIVEEVIIVCHEAGEAYQTIGLLEERVNTTRLQLNHALDSIENTPCGMMVVRETGEVIQANRSALEILGADREGWTNLYRLDSPSGSAPAAPLRLPGEWVSNRILAHKSDGGQVVQLPDVRGQMKEIVITCLPIRDRDGLISAHSLSFIEKERISATLDRQAVPRAAVEAKR